MMIILIVTIKIIIMMIIRFDWSSEEKLLNSFPHFTTEISGLQVHFIRAQPKPKKGQVMSCFQNSQHDEQHDHDLDDHHLDDDVDDHHHQVVLPLLLVHGWPGSVIEFLDIIPLLVKGNGRAVNIIFTTLAIFFFIFVFIIIIFLFIIIIIIIIILTFSGCF